MLFAPDKQTHPIMTALFWKSNTPHFRPIELSSKPFYKRSHLLQNKVQILFWEKSWYKRITRSTCDNYHDTITQCKKVGIYIVLLPCSWQKNTPNVDSFVLKMQHTPFSTNRIVFKTVLQAQSFTTKTKFRFFFGKSRGINGLQG